MSRRLTAVLIATALIGCSRDADPQPPATAEAPMTARDDLEVLRKHLTLPPEIERATWLAVPRGKPSMAPGPTDLMLLARFPLGAAAWSALEPRLGPAKPAQRVEIDPRLRGVLPSGDEAVEGAVYDVEALRTVRWGGGWAIWDGEALVVQLFSR